MLLKHIENVRQKSENYRTLYAVGTSVVFTGIIASLWVFSFFIPTVNSASVSNSASATDAVDSANISPTGIVKQETGNIFGSIFDSIKEVGNKPFLGNQYKVNYGDGALTLQQNTDGSANGGAPTSVDGVITPADNASSADSADGVEAEASSTIITPENSVVSTTTKDGFTVEAGN